MNRLNDKVQVTLVGRIVAMELMSEGRIKYEITDDERNHCYVFGENLITIHKGESNAITDST